MADVKLIAYSTDALGDPLAEQPFAQCNKAATNSLKWSNDQSHATWIKNGSATAIRDQPGLEGNANTATSIHVGTNGVDNIKSAGIYGLGANVNGYIRLFLRAVSTVGIIRITPLAGAGLGVMVIDLSLVSTTELELLDITHPAVSYPIPFSADAGGASGVNIFSYSGGFLDAVIGNIEYYNNVTVTDYHNYNALPPIFTTTAPASIPALEYTYDSLNLDPSDATINITIDWQGDDTQILTMGDLSLSIGPIGDGIELYSNTGFDTDTIWNKGTGWTISGGEAHAVNSVWSQLNQGPPLTIGDGYIAQLDITANGPINALHLIVGGAGGFVSSNVVGHLICINRSAKDPNAYVRGAIDWTGSIDNFSLQRMVTGLILTDGTSQRLEIPISVTAGIHDVVIELAPTYMALIVDGGTREVIGYTPIAAGTITIAETFRDFTINGLVPVTTLFSSEFTNEFN